MVNRKTLRERIFNVLMKAVIHGAIKPGDRLKEEEIVGWFGASRTPVREAIHMLEASGVVHHVPARGAIVSPMSLKRSRDVVWVRRALESAAVPEIIGNATDTEMANLLESVSTAEALLASGDIESTIELNKNFHLRLIQLTDNTTLENILTGIDNSSSLVNRASIQVPGRLEQALSEHRDIAERIAHHDVEAAIQAVQSHYDHVHDNLPRALDLITERNEPSIHRFFAAEGLANNRASE